MTNPITATVVRTPYKTYRVTIHEGALRDNMTPYEVTNKVKAEAVAEFINNMHPETRAGWLSAWRA